MTEPLTATNKLQGVSDMTKVQVRAPLAMKAIYLLRHILNSQNRFNNLEHKVLRRLNKKYKNYPPGKTIELERVPLADFDFSKVPSGKITQPFIIKGFCEPTKLSWPELKEKFGSGRVLLHPNASLSEDFRYEIPKMVPFREALECMEENEFAYITGATQIFEDCPELLPLVGSEDIARKFKRDIMTTELFMGGPSVGSTFHSANVVNFFVMAHGRKKWTFVAPDNFMALYPEFGRNREEVVRYSPICTADYETKQKSKFPLYDKITKYTVTLEPGDLLCNPSNWWHEVVNLDRSIGVPHRVHGPREFNFFLLFAPFSRHGLNFAKHILARTFLRRKPTHIVTDNLLINSFGGEKKQSAKNTKNHK